MEEIHQYLSTRHKPENINDRHQKSLTIQDRMAVGLTNAVGTMYAVYFFFSIIIGWMFWQSKILSEPFDPYPFAFLLFLGNIVQLLLMPLIMVGQNLQGRHSELRAEEEYRATHSTYQDIEKIIKILTDQQEEIKRLNKIIKGSKD